MSSAEVVARLRSELTGQVRTDMSLAPFTTYRLGGPAAVYVEPNNIDDVEAFGRVLHDVAPELPVLALGRGSNLVISDRGWEGVVIRFGSAFSWLAEESDGESSLRSGAATPMPLLANWAARRGLSGLEFAIAIPGSVGGAIRMNAGAHGRETGDALVSARLFDLDSLAVVEKKVSDFDYSYRHSNVTDRQLAVDARWHLDEEEPGAVRDRMEEYRRHRAATQPGAVQNAGSVFKNPPGDSAGRLVEAAGLKGWRIGGAYVSTLHANFFIAEEGSTSQDVYDLVHSVRARVNEQFGIELEPEIRFAGSYDRPPSVADLPSEDGG
ncbi:MAG: UDP-N-acetylmuramate dehydrogenase [Actinomycetota bacterium]|nr:UDP-N-acetylmuramate dehydrogenase [Actinomycetota bacterium]